MRNPIDLILQSLAEIHALLKMQSLLLHRVLKRQEIILETQAQEAIELNAIATDLGAVAEAIKQLEAAQTAGNTTPDVDTAVANLKAAVANIHAAFTPVVETAAPTV